MSVLEIVKERLRKEEGLRLKPYRCSAGKLTIGYGRNFEDNGISIGEAEFMLDNDVKSVIQQLSVKIPWIKTLTENRQVVLVDMAFNLGIGGLLLFKNTLAMIQKGEYEAAAKAMLQSKWATQVGKRANELSELMRLG